MPANDTPTPEVRGLLDQANSESDASWRTVLRNARSNQAAQADLINDLCGLVEGLLENRNALAAALEAREGAEAYRVASGRRAANIAALRHWREDISPNAPELHPAVIAASGDDIARRFEWALDDVERLNMAIALRGPNPPTSSESSGASADEDEALFGRWNALHDCVLPGPLRRAGDCLAIRLRTVLNERDAALASKEAAESLVYFAVGLMSTQPQWSSKHPQELLEWLRDQHASISTQMDEIRTRPAPEVPEVPEVRECHGCKHWTISPYARDFEKQNQYGYCRGMRACGVEIETTGDCSVDAIGTDATFCCKGWEAR